MRRSSEVRPGSLPGWFEDEARILWCPHQRLYPLCERVGGNWVRHSCLLRGQSHRERHAPRHFAHRLN